MEITGKIVRVLQEQTGSGTRGTWSRQDFIIETDEQYPKKVCISNWNNKVDIASLAMGTTITCHINLESREFNERWFTDVRVWKMDVLSAGASTTTNTATSKQTSNDAPFPDSKNIPWNDESGDKADDLPF